MHGDDCTCGLELAQCLSTAKLLLLAGWLVMLVGPVACPPARPPACLSQLPAGAIQTSHGLELVFTASGNYTFTSSAAQE